MNSLFKWAMALLCAFVLGACGGGGSGPSATASSGTTGGTGGTTGNSTAAPTVTLSLSTNSVSPTVSATVNATVLDAAGAPVANTVVTFAMTTGLGALSSSTALTNTAGVATVTLTTKAGTAAGADTLTASATVATVAVTASTGFQSSGSAATGSSSIALSLSTTSISSSASTTVKAKLTDTAGQPIANSVVSFTTSAGLGSFNQNTALTDSTGTAVVLMYPTAATGAGADTVVASATIGADTVTSSAGFQSSGSTASSSPSLAMSLSSTTVTAARPATVTVLLLDGASKPVSNAVVTFKTTLGYGSFNVSTALTDSTGTALVVLSPSSSSTAGADTLVATALVGTSAVTASQGFQLTATNVTVSSFISSSGSAALSAYGQTALTLTLGNAASGVPVTVTASSTCVSAGKATLTPASTTTTNGVAIFTFKDGGCGATATNDVVQATIGASTATASVNVPLTSPTVSAISFQSASPSAIFLRGSGYAETSTVVFKVVDLAGNALPNQSVVLHATTLAGGLTLDGVQADVTKLSDSGGLVSVLVNSGTVPTPVRIQASLSVPGGGSVTTVSSSLAIGVGLPSEANFSMSEGTFNIEGYNIDGSANTYSIIASDRMGNPVPAGTTISFVTEGGQIVSSQQIALTNGLARATANFISAAPRPTDGRITIVAYALGEESFLDLNGNNVYDAGEDFQDLGDVYIDRGFTGVFDATNDQVISLSLGGTAACHAATSSLLQLDASIPSRPATCDGVWGKSYVRRAVETVLSTSAASPVWGITRPTAIAGASCSTSQLVYDDLKSYNFYPVGPDGLVVPGASGAFGFYVSDANPVRLNPMAATTVVSASATTGLAVTVNGGTTAAVPNTLSANAVSIGYSFATGTTSGTITLGFASPGGLKTTVALNVRQQLGGVPCPLMAAAVSATSPSTIALQFSQPMDTTQTPLASAFVDVGAGHAIASVAWASSTVLNVVVATPYAHLDVPDLKYSIPATGAIRTLATAATATATAIQSLPLSSFDHLSINGF